VKKPAWQALPDSFLSRERLKALFLDKFRHDSLPGLLRSAVINRAVLGLLPEAKAERVWNGRV
jgi:hypothetical protein